MLQREGGHSLPRKGRSYSLRRERKEQLPVPQEERAAQYFFGQKEQWPGLGLHLKIHFAYMERATHSIARMSALFSLNGDEKRRSDSQSTCLRQDHRGLLVK